MNGSDLSPPNASPLERVLADLEYARIDAVSLAVVRQVVDPDTCPAALLPWLAYSMSVDAWSDAWPVATQRAVIKAAPEVHRIKGTRRAVRLALEALGIAFDLVEWWEADPPARRGTFEATIWATGDGPDLDLVLQNLARQAIRAAKPKSRVFTLRLGARPTGFVYVGAALRNLLKIRVEAA